MKETHEKKTYSMPSVLSTPVVAIVPLAAIAAVTVVQMLAVGALAGGAAVGVAKLVGHHHLTRSSSLPPTEK